MDKFAKYAKAFGDVIAKPLFVLLGIAGLLVGFGATSVTLEDLKKFAVVFGSICIVMGILEPNVVYAKSVFQSVKGKK